MVFPKLKKTIQEVARLPISKNRKELLDKITVYIQQKLDKKQPVLLHFICTHNSRRSQIAQAWAQILAFDFNLPITCFSGGVEVTACYKTAFRVLEKAGAKIHIKHTRTNPVIEVYYAKNNPPLKLLSKVYDDAQNPKTNFAAIMTCSDADKNCPFIPGTEKRLSLPYEDPKIADNTPFEEEKYSERSLQIASEMYYIYSQAKIKI